MSSYLFTIGGQASIDLDPIIQDLRDAVDAPDGPPLKVSDQLGSQSGAQEYVVVIRGSEDPHIHPDGDLIAFVMEGGGYFELFPGSADAPLGSVVVIPKGLCHAFHNQSPDDSVLFVSFAPINSKDVCPPSTSSDSGTDNQA